MPDAPDIVLCSKLCRHNPADPTPKPSEEKGSSRDMEPSTLEKQSTNAGGQEKTRGDA